MGKEKSQIEQSFTKEETEILKTSLLERLTYYDYKIVKLKIEKMKAPTEALADKIQHEIDYYYKNRAAISKWLSFVGGNEK